MTEKRYIKTLTEVEREAYVARAKARVSKQSQETREHLLGNVSVWGPGESIRDYETDCFLNNTGSVILKPDELKTGFFNNDPRRNEYNGHFGSRGANYFVSLNPLRNTVSEKLGVIRKDIEDISNEIISPEISWKEKLAMLDYAKQHALTIYHALQYPKRFGISLSRRHNEAIKIAERVAVASTTAFYMHILGHQVDISFLSQLKDVVRTANTFGLETNHFKMVELDNPLIILGNAYANSIKYSETEAIIALPAGGTQPRIATKICMELAGKKPELHFIPLSTHSTKKQPGEELSEDQLAELIAETKIENKKVLVTEDNSNTGKTLTKMTDAIKRFGPTTVNSSLAELDPWRVFVKSQFGTMEVTDESHPDFDTSVSVVPITRGFLPDRHVRKISAQKIVFSGLEVRDEKHKTPLTEDEYIRIIESQEYKDFRDVYEDVLRRVGDKYGYRNPFMVAQEILKGLNPTKL